MYHSPDFLTAGVGKKTFPLKLFNSGHKNSAAEVLKKADGYSICWSSQCVLTNFPFFLLVLLVFKWLPNVEMFSEGGEGEGQNKLYSSGQHQNTSGGPVAPHCLLTVQGSSINWKDSELINGCLLKFPGVDLFCSWCSESTGFDISRPFSMQKKILCGLDPWLTLLSFYIDVWLRAFLWSAPFLVSGACDIKCYTCFDSQLWKKNEYSAT